MYSSSLCLRWVALETTFHKISPGTYCIPYQVSTCPTACIISLPGGRVVKQGPELLIGLQVLALTSVEISGNKGAARFIGGFVEERQGPLQGRPFGYVLFSRLLLVCPGQCPWEGGPLGQKKTGAGFLCRFGFPL